MNIMITLVLTGTGMIQDVPVDIPKSELPKLATCTICKDEHGQEKPAGGVRYKGQAYYFCNTKEIANFKKDPEAFVPPVIPRSAPDFDLSDMAGVRWHKDTMAQKVVLIDWWATWCKPCIEMFPKIDAIRAKYATKGFEVLSVSIDEKAADLTKFLGKRTFANPVLHDTKQTWDKWGVKAIPMLFLVKNGQIIGQWTGKVDPKVLEKAVESALQ